uniref:DUF1360 domain-containing protein n=1 Tax=Streptomyces sp. NBC_01393 TaxID=2903851 RepID=A0AAU3HQ08_9ACTN
MLRRPGPEGDIPSGVTLLDLSILALLGLGGYRGTQLAVHDIVLDPIRDRGIAWHERRQDCPVRTAVVSLISCVYCMGWWGSGALLATYLLATGARRRCCSATAWSGWPWPAWPPCKVHEAVAISAQGDRVCRGGRPHGGGPHPPQAAAYRRRAAPGPLWHRCPRGRREFSHHEVAP